MYMDRGPAPELNRFVYWIAVLIAIELLPVSLAFESQVVMSFPIHLAIAMLYPPWVSMTIAGIGAFDPREFKREVSLHQALFNRAQQMLTVGIASAAFTPFREGLEQIDVGWNSVRGIVLAAVLATVVNLVLVALHVHYRASVPLSQAFGGLLPEPIAGFWLSYAVLTTLGGTTAIVYARLGEFGSWAIAAFLMPLLFARLTIMGARAKQQLSERVHQQQRALIEATEKIFTDREQERGRIAERIHDSSLQLLAGASYACQNAQELLDAGRQEEAERLLVSARSAIEEAIGSLRGSLVELRKPFVEQGGLLDAVRDYLDQIETLWQVEVVFEADLKEEPPLSVSVGLFQILQEGLVNALKHAQTERITVKMKESAGRIHLIVQDEGAGFDPEAEVDEEHLGMQLMKRRAVELGGWLNLWSRPGEGTRLEAVFPGAPDR